MEITQMPSFSHELSTDFINSLAVRVFMSNYQPLNKADGNCVVVATSTNRKEYPEFIFPVIVELNKNHNHVPNIFGKR